MNTAKDVNLIQLPGKTRNSTVVVRPLGKPHELTFVVFDDQAKPAAICDGKCIPPLPFP
jgi:hypothetical protein